ncbi:MAG: hypothetical protein OEU35_02280 [Desulfuromonadales bacterium]|nr:hypothetical protein [Desulfuromonadales bacterium]
MARDQNITDKEVGAIQGIVMAVSAGKINTLMREFTSPSRD